MNCIPNSRLPRAIRGSVMAATGDANQILSQLNTAFSEFRARNDARLNAIECAVDKQIEDSAIARHGGPAFGAPVDSEYSTTFASYVRKGDGADILRDANASGYRANVQAAMSVGDNSSGGYLAPVEWDRKIQQAQRATSPMRRLATVQTTGVGAYSTLWSDDAWGSGWVGETAARPATTTATLSPINFTTGEIYANIAATQRIIDDAEFNLEQWLADRLNAEFSRQEDVAFLSGNGVNKPSGLLLFATGGALAASHPGGPLAVVNSGAAANLTVDGLIGFMYSLPAPYRQNATWLMSSTTAAALTKMKDGDGNLIWRESLMAGQPATLFGRPVEIDEGMPAPEAGNLAIAFGDFRAGYLINDRIGTRILRDPFSNKPFVMFYATKRVGGGVLDPNAIRLLKIAA